MKYNIGLLFLMFCLPCISSETYNNPVDGKNYTGDWKKYFPQGQGNTAVEQQGRVVMGEVRLLSSEAMIAENISVEEIVSLIGQTRDILVKEIEPFKESGEILMQVSINAESDPEFKMAYQGNLNQKLLQAFYDKLAQIKARTKKSNISFQVHYTIKEA